MAPKEDVYAKIKKFSTQCVEANLNQKANDLGKPMKELFRQNPEALNSYPEMGELVSNLANCWVETSNARVTQDGMEALTIIAAALESNYKAHAHSVHAIIVKKMSSSNETVREKIREYFLKCVEVGVYSPSGLVENMCPLLTDKNRDKAGEAQKIILEILIWTAREDKKMSSQVLKDLTKKEAMILNSQSFIRDIAERAMRELAAQQGYKQTIKICDELSKSGTQLKKLQALIDEFKNELLQQIQSGEVGASSGAPPLGRGQGDDNTDFAAPRPVTGSTGSPLPVAKKPSVKPKPKVETNETGQMKATKAKGVSSQRPRNIGVGEAYRKGSGPAGDADEAWFVAAFEDQPTIIVTTRADFLEIQNKLVSVLDKKDDDWPPKIDALRSLRALLSDQVKGFEEEKLQLVKRTSNLLLILVRDLRTQLAREACLTFAYICIRLQNKVESHFCDCMLGLLITSTQNISIKVISMSACVTLQYLLLNVNHQSLVKLLVQALGDNKSPDARLAICETLPLILQNWPKNKLDSIVPILMDGIKRGLSDTKTESRVASRKAYWAFWTKYREQANAFLKTLDSYTQKQLMAGQEHLVEQTKPRSATAGVTNTARMNVTRHGSFHRDQDTPRRDLRSSSNAPPQSVRSTSAIDLNAANRAKVRQQYAALSRQKVGSGASLPRPARKLDTVSSPMSGQYNPERTGRTRNRVAGVSQSQPSSRSGSPSSRLGYHTYHMPESNSLAYQSRRVPPRSQGTSRETSPNRFGSKRSLENLFQNKRRGERPPIQPTSRPVMAQKMLAQSLEAEQSEMPLYDNEPDSLGHKVSPRKTSYRPFEDHSDDSDASSLCSERSFDSYRRPSDSFSWSGSQQRLYRDVWDSGVKNIVEIIEKCESTHWGDRKEGLVALQEWLKSGNTLSPIELKRVTEIFTRMFMDSHTKVFSLFLDTLNELVMVHRSDLNSWLYVLLTRLLNKLGSDLLSSIQNKILKSLDVIRDSFPPELQMSTVLRFLIDPVQTPNLRVKTAALNFVTKLCPLTDPAQAFPAPTPSPGSQRYTDREKDPTTLALQRMIGWTMGEGIKQGNELRRAAQEAIIALFNLNTPQVTLRLANLPQEYQEAAATLLRGRVRRSSINGGGSGSPTSPLLSRDYPRLSSPGPQHQTHHRSSDSDSHSINPEEIYRSLRKTTAEIQNYTYEAGTEKPPDRDNTTSKDSGISQLSGTEALEEAMEDLSIQSSSSGNATSSTLTNRVLTVRDCNGMDTTDNNQQEDGFDEQEAMRKIVEALRSPPDSDNGENISIISESEKRASLGHLTRLIRDSSVSILQENFKALLRILLSNLSVDPVSRDVQTRILVLSALTELVKKRAMTDSLNHYVELLILKVLNSYKDTSKEVGRSAESCANTIATTLAPSLVIKVLSPLIQTGEYPLNLAAVKMLTRLVEAHGREPVYSFLPDLMPGLIQAYDNEESSVRKSAVFCMVSLHAAIGEEDLKPHLVALNGSKLKLLHLYIRRSQQGSSAPTSPRNHPPPSS